MTAPLVLGFETSCDETGVGIVRDGSCSPTHSPPRRGARPLRRGRAGGRRRAHVEAMVPTVHRALETAGVKPGEIDAVAVTAGPGLAGPLMVGVAAAKAYALGLGAPLRRQSSRGPRRRRHARIRAAAAGMHRPAGLRWALVAARRAGDLAHQEIEALGATVDDAAGEAYDKVARLLGMAFPGRPADRPRGGGRHRQHRLPPRQGTDGTLDFSFSGLKTAVARWIESRRRSGEPVPVADVAASFQEAVADVLTAKAITACRAARAGHLVIGGGVAANSRLRALATERCERAGLRLRIPRRALCTDNGAMVAALGAGCRSRPACSPAS